MSCAVMLSGKSGSMPSRLCRSSQREISSHLPLATMPSWMVPRLPRYQTAKGYWRMELPSVYIFTIGLPLRVASVNALLSMGMQSTVTGLPASMYGQVCRNSHRPRMMVSGFAIRSSYLVKIRCCRREDLVAVLLFHRFEPLSLRELMVPSAEAVFRMAVQLRRIGRDVLYLAGADICAEDAGFVQHACFHRYEGAAVFQYGLIHVLLAVRELLCAARCKVRIPDKLCGLAVHGNNTATRRRELQFISHGYFPSRRQWCMEGLPRRLSRTAVTTKHCPLYFCVRSPAFVTMSDTRPRTTMSSAPAAISASVRMRTTYPSVDLRPPEDTVTPWPPYQNTLGNCAGV
nr:MAG TPA: hypothetical protein [Caudoviricetes sp.]